LELAGAAAAVAVAVAGASGSDSGSGSGGINVCGVGGERKEGRKEEDDVLLVEAKTQLSINIKCLLSFGVTSASLL